MREKYRLPFDRVERHGLRFYDRFIAVSDWLARDLRWRRPEADVATIPNGVEEIAYEATSTSPKHLLFVGRLDVAHKGCDFLLDILVRIRRMRGGRVPPLVVVGDGPDREAMERAAARLGLSSVVDFRGRVEGPEKYQLMADSHAVLMPSRHETFGMVAVESLAAGAPLVAFDVGPLREVTGCEPGGETGARLVAPYDLDAFAREVARLIDAPTSAGTLREAGRHWARRYDWERISTHQEDFYLRATGGDPSRRSASQHLKEASTLRCVPAGDQGVPRVDRETIGIPSKRRPGRNRRVGKDHTGRTAAPAARRGSEEGSVFAVHPFGRKLLRVGVNSPLLQSSEYHGSSERRFGLLRRLVAMADILDVATYLWLVRVRSTLAARLGDQECLVVGDRSMDNVLVKHQRQGTLSGRLAALIRRLVPQFRLTIWLEVSPEVAMARDNDFDLRHYEKLYGAYSTAAKRFGWQVVREDGRGPEEVCASIVEELAQAGISPVARTLG